MKRFLRFRIFTLLAITTAVACAFAIGRPFDPNIAFVATTATDERLDEGGTYPSLQFTFRNDGRFPVWYNNSGPLSCDMIIRQFPANETADWVWIMPDDGLWTRVDPGNMATVNVPFDTGATRLKIGVKLADWIGRDVECWSDTVNPTQIQNGG
jgi:hypothetical protein